MNLFLDDVRDPENVKWVKVPNVEWTVVRNYTEFTDAIKKFGIPNFVAYDHDLADEHYNSQNTNNYTEKTGHDCALFLIDICAKLNRKHPEYVVHSMNPVGKERIRNIITKFNNTFDIF